MELAKCSATQSRRQRRKVSGSVADSFDVEPGTAGLVQVGWRRRRAGVWLADPGAQPQAGAGTRASRAGVSTVGATGPGRPVKRRPSDRLSERRPPNAVAGAGT